MYLTANITKKNKMTSTEELFNLLHNIIFDSALFVITYLHIKPTVT